MLLFILSLSSLSAVAIEIIITIAAIFIDAFVIGVNVM